jgi:hypothetical protein
MSTAFALAATSAVLKSMLESAVVRADVSGVVGDVSVSAVPPDRLDDDTSLINLFLYQVTANAGWRNNGLPSRDSRGHRVTNAPLALDLHYLVTASGPEDLQAELLLGIAMHLLHEMPTLTAEQVRAVFTPPVHGSLPPMLQRLATAGLDQQPELVKVTPKAMSSEEMSNLWAVFGEKYRPTAAFVASVVLIEGTASTRAALPVTKPARLTAIPLPHLVVDRVEPAVVTAGAATRLTLHGSGLDVNGTSARFGNGDESSPEPGSTDRTMVVELPPGLRAGVNTVQALRRVFLGEPPEERTAFDSNVVPFVLAPRVVSVHDSAGTSPAPGVRDATVTVRLSPPVAKRQRVTLLLNERGGTHAYSFEAPSRMGDAAEETDTVAFAVRGVAAGTYLLRVRVDGAESALDAGDDGFTGPLVAP